jgi:hypothetical protein
MEPAVKTPLTPTHPGVNEQVPRVDHLPRSDEVIIPEHLPGVELLAAGACVNPCLERTGIFGESLTLNFFLRGPFYFPFS